MVPLVVEQGIATDTRIAVDSLGIDEIQLEVQIRVVGWLVKANSPSEESGRSGRLTGKHLPIGVFRIDTDEHFDGERRGTQCRVIRNFHHRTAACAMGAPETQCLVGGGGNRIAHRIQESLLVPTSPYTVASSVPGFALFTMFVPSASVVPTSPRSSNVYHTTVSAFAANAANANAPKTAIPTTRISFIAYPPLCVIIILL